MTARIELEKRLRAANDDLENRVRERTDELKAANESLRLEAVERIRSEESRVCLLHKIVKTQEDERKRIACESSNECETTVYVRVPIQASNAETSSKISG